MELRFYSFWLLPTSCRVAWSCETTHASHRCGLNNAAEAREHHHHHLISSTIRTTLTLLLLHPALPARETPPDCVARLPPIDARVRSEWHIKSNAPLTLSIYIVCVLAFSSCDTDDTHAHPRCDAHSQHASFAIDVHLNKLITLCQRYSVYTRNVQRMFTTGVGGQIQLLYLAQTRDYMSLRCVPPVYRWVS